MIGHTPFRLVYGQEAVMPMEYIVPSLIISAFTDMDDPAMLYKRLAQITKLEEDRFIAGFQQQIQKAREKAWHDRHIEKKQFQIGDLVLLYDSKFMKFPGKFKTHWKGPYIVQEVTDGGAVQLAKLNGEILTSRVNGSSLKKYRDKPGSPIQK